MKNILVPIFITILFFCYNVYGQKTAYKNDKELIRQLKGNWSIDGNLTDCIIILTNFNWTTENINNHFNYLNFYVLDNKIKSIIIRTNSFWGCGTAEVEGQEYKTSNAVWDVRNGLLHIELKYNYQNKNIELNNYYTVIRHLEKLILKRRSKL